jgi:outer membrane protein
MKTHLSIIALMLCLGVAPSALLAQSSGSQSKIGVVNMEAAIWNTGEGKKAMADLQKKYLPRQQEAQKLQQDIQAINDQLQKQQATLSDEEQRRLSRDLEDKQKLLKRTSEDAQADFGNDREEAYNRIGQKLLKQINDFASKNGFALIIGSDRIPIYFASSEMDLTEQVVKLFDAANPVEAPTTGGAATHAPAKPVVPAKK